MDDVIEYIKENKSNKSKIQPILDRCREAGVKPTEVTDIDLVNELHDMIG